MNATILHNRKVLITAGPTREAIDPVRYISNHSSGKMGYAIAEQFLQQGTQVFMVSGPVAVSLQHPGLTIVQVNSASEMHMACCHFFEETDIAVFAAAVADYRPAKVAEQKIRKDDSSFMISMVKNVDIAYEFGRIKRPGQLSVGFALETNNELVHAEGKLYRKNFDMVVLNSMNDNKATFGHDTNKVTLLRRGQTPKEFSLKHKSEVAKDIVREISSLLVDRYEHKELVQIE